MDEKVRMMQGAGIHLQLILKSASSFFERIKSDSELKNMIAKAERVPHYTAIIDFVRTLLKARDSFNIIGFHANTNYTGIIWTIKWLTH